MYNLIIYYTGKYKKEDQETRNYPWKPILEIAKIYKIPRIEHDEGDEGDLSLFTEDKSQLIKACSHIEKLEHVRKVEMKNDKKPITP